MEIAYQNSHQCTQTEASIVVVPNSNFLLHASAYKSVLQFPDHVLFFFQYKSFPAICKFHILHKAFNHQMSFVLFSFFQFERSFAFQCFSARKQLMLRMVHPLHHTIVLWGY